MFSLPIPPLLSFVIQKTILNETHDKMQMERNSTPQHKLEVNAFEDRLPKVNYYLKGRTIMKKNRTTRWIAFLLTLALSLTLVSTSAFAANNYSAIVYNNYDYLVVTKDDAPLRASASNKGAVYAEAEEAFSYIPPLYRWYNNGGLVTHEHLKHLRKTLRAEIFAYLDRLPVNIEISVRGERYILAHAAPVEDYPMFDYRYNNEREFAVWKRYRAGERRVQDYTLIFGHTPTSSYQNANPLEIWYGTKCIDIDCGCAYPYGRLACLRLDDMYVFYSEESNEQV